MRKAIVSALMMTLLLLPGCGEREERLQEGFDALRKAVTAAQSIRFQAEMTADDGENVAQYTLDVSYDGQQTTVEILAPALIAGVKATALRGESTISYDGVILGAGPVDNEGLTAMSAMPVMLDAIASAYVELLWWEEGSIAARLYVGERSVLTLWLDRDTCLPVAGEFAADGRTSVTCRFTGWEMG